MEGDHCQQFCLACARNGIQEDQLMIETEPQAGAVAQAEESLPAEAIPPADQPSPDDALLSRLDAIEHQLAEFHRRSAHREEIINRLHEDNQRLKQGEQRVVLEPVIADLIRLHEQLARQARRTPDDGMLASFVDEVDEILNRCGIEVFMAIEGDPYRSDRHKPLAVVPTTDPGLHNTVAEPIAAGFIDRMTDRVRRPAQARFYQSKPAEE
jgi:molecular chaperone GrpE